MIKSISLFAMFATASVFAFAETDNTFMVKQVMSYMAPRCGSREHATESRPSLVEYCWNDTNRLVSALKELAMTNKEYYASMSLRELGVYGTASDIPFLYSCATNPICGDCAIKSIIAIEGITSNSISLVSHYLESDIATSQKSNMPADVCGEFVRKTVTSSLSHDVITNALGVVYAFAKLRNTGHIWLDRNLTNADPSYRFSKRRLCIMRTIANRTLNDYQSNYVTNAINELVAYPESELPD